MSQITIYLDNNTINLVNKSASQEHESVSAWIKKRILRSLSNEWPASFRQSLGRLEKDDLVEPKEIDFSKDARREQL